MASPPAYTQSPIALSPPQPSNSQLPLTAAALRNNASAVIGHKKRPSIAGDGNTAPSVNKRRKASTMSVTSVPPGSAHPLRQTSFPPEDMGGPRSPSAFSDNMSIVSGSQVSAVGSGVGPLLKKKRGRKSKAEKAREAELAKATGSSAAPSVGGGAGGGAADGKSVAGGGKGGEEHAEEEEDNEDNVHMSITSAKRSEAQAQEEKRLRAMLTRCMDADQFDRYSNWRAAKLPDPVVRRVSLGRYMSTLDVDSFLTCSTLITDRKRNGITISATAGSYGGPHRHQILSLRYHNDSAPGAGRVDREWGGAAGRSCDGKRGRKF